MKHGDKYRHFKGAEYTFRGIALPLQGLYFSDTTIEDMEYIGTVRYHEDTHDIELYAIEHILLLELDKPHVIYQSEKDYGTDKYWAREVDDFFGYKNVEGAFVKKFALMN